MWNMMSDMCGIDYFALSELEFAFFYYRPATRDVCIFSPFRAGCPEGGAANHGCNPSFTIKIYSKLHVVPNQSLVTFTAVSCRSFAFFFFPFVGALMVL